MKLFQLLACLSKVELRLLRKAVNSPLHNSNQKVISLFDILRPLHPNFDNSVKARQKIYKKLFPNKPYNDYNLRWHFTEFTKVIEELLLYIEQKNNQFERQKQLTIIYNKRSLPTYFKKNIADLQEQLAQNNLQSAENSLDKLSILEMTYFHPSHDKYDLADQTLKMADEELDIFFALKKYRLAIALKGRSQVLQEVHNYRFLDAVTNEVRHGFLYKNKLLNLYNLAITLTETTTPFKDFETYETSFFSDYPHFSLQDQQFLYFTGLNFLIKEFNKSNAGFKVKTLAWYKFGLSTKIIFEQSKIIENAFANIIIIGCKSNQFDWVEQFINTYQDHLATANLKVTILYYKGIFYYLQKKYDKALKLLLNSDKKSIYPPRLRTILARIIFEKFLLDKSYFEVLLANLTAYEYYLKRNKSIAVAKLKEHQNFIKVLRYFAKKVFAKVPKETIQHWFNNFIKKDNPLLAKSWLEEKLKQF